jgi:hypothetical protein
MANTPKWLSDYYGASCQYLNPIVVQEGKQWAIVRLMKAAKTPGYSSVGYVLIKKTGRHIATPHFSLHEGVAQEADLQRMQKALQEKDADS